MVSTTPCRLCGWVCGCVGGGSRLAGRRSRPRAACGAAWVHGARRITNCTRRSVRNGAHGGYDTCVGARRLRARHVTSHGAFHGACLFHACYYFIPGVCVCKLSLWTMRASRNLACLVGRTQASEFLFSTRKLGPKFKMGSPPLCEYTFSSSSSSSSSSSDSAT